VLRRFNAGRPDDDAAAARVAAPGGGRGAAGGRAAAGPESGVEAAGEGRRIPIVVTAGVSPAEVEAGGPIPLTIRVANGLPGEIELVGYGVEPTAWNGETLNVSLVDIDRDGLGPNLFLERPAVEPPVRVAGMSREVIGPGRALTITTDARKWSIRGGWRPGRYRVTVRVGNLRVDAFSTVDVLSEPVELVVRQQVDPCW
jgi:hypothetical protein